MEAKTIMITGASSGLGKALAVEYAAPETTLLLYGRNLERLQEVATACVARGAQARIAVADVTDPIKMAAQINDFDAFCKLDLVIANAGISAGTGGGTENAEQVRRIFTTNVNGVLNTVLPIIPRMKAKGGGQIAIVSSIAGYRGQPGAPAYAASKAAVKSWGEGLRPDLAPHGIQVNVICPGFVETPMTSVNHFKMPFIMKPEKAAKIIRKGLEQNKARISFPWPMAGFMWLAALLPPAWTDGILAKAPKKD